MKQKKVWIAQYRILFIIVAVLLAVAVPVSAYFIRNSGEVTNTFTPAASVQPQIEETFVNHVKSNVFFQVGETDYPVYVRAAIVVTWQKENSTVYFSEPIENTDYTLALSLDASADAAGWVKGEDGYFYYRTIVESGGETEVLIEKCEPLGSETTPEGYTLNVDVLVQTVQAIGYTDADGENSAPEIPAYKDAWGLSSPGASS